MNKRQYNSFLFEASRHTKLFNNIFTILKNSDNSYIFEDEDLHTEALSKDVEEKAKDKTDVDSLENSKEDVTENSDNYMLRPIQSPILRLLMQPYDTYRY